MDEIKIKKENIVETKINKNAFSIKSKISKFFLFAILIAIIVFSPLLKNKFLNKDLVYKDDPFFAVFLTNNQVYFGKIDRVDNFIMVLKDVYYIQMQEENRDFGTPLKLIKLGTEIHGPEDILNINKNHIVFYEPLKEESNIVQSIEASKKKDIDNI